MVDYDKEYYKQPGLWNGSPPSKIALERINKTISLIPKDVKTVLEVGCGGGNIVNTLQERSFD